MKKKKKMVFSIKDTQTVLILTSLSFLVFFIFILIFFPVIML